MPRRSFLITGFCFSLFFHAAPLFFIAPGITVARFDPSNTEAIFLGAILKEVDVAPPGAWVKPSRRVDLLDKALALSPERSESADRVPEKPFSRLFSEDIKKSSPQASLAVGPAAVNRVTFALSDAGTYFMNIDFSDIVKRAARDGYSGVLEVEAVVSAEGIVERVGRVTGSGDPVLDNAIVLRLKKAILRSPWTQDGARFRFKIVLKAPKGTHVPN